MGHLLFEQTLGSGFAVSEPFQNPIQMAHFGLLAERKQTPQIVDKPRDGIEALEAVRGAPEQKVGGSNPPGRTTPSLPCS